MKIIGFNDNETTLISDYKYEVIHNNLESITNEVNLFQNKLEKDGYLNNTVISAKFDNDSVFVTKIHLKNKIENIVIYIDSTISSKSFYSNLKLPELNNNSFVLEYNSIEQELKKYNQIVSSSGYPFSNLKLSDIKQKDSATLSAKLEIDTKEQIRKLDKVIIKGYEKFPVSYLKRYLKIDTGKPFNLESINKKVITLNNLSFANQTKPPEILFSKDSTQLYLYLEKTPSNNFDGFIGFTTNETSNKIEFNGYLNLYLENNLNYGESLYLDYKSDESDQKNFNLKANLPYIFGSPLGVEASLAILKRDSTFINTKQQASLFYQLNDKNSIYLGLESTESSNLSNSNIINNVEDFNSVFYTTRYQYIKRQNLEKLFQIKSLFKVQFGIGKRDTNIFSETQTLIDVSAHHIFNLNPKNSIYLKAIVQSINSDTYLENELFRFGGINTIRGFTENSLSANSLYILNSEYRYKLSSSIFINSVIDIGNFSNNVINQKENLYGFGFGFGILTKGGLLRFIYANGKTDNETFNFSNSKIHLSLNATF
ncbi:ShlB/FhaC/HecB family hemolysin secretion/activation protein [Olleya sp. YS]|uniref:ShlB/FhaC/HecB family hemolysin secretion/activation protein n=1 Tax=Olleya sp. YS TaxID=3028318 RepID=UPI00243432D9|nr:ShlB/FhaC/HecB family hemolysin secretion/activation protein [Olleya sp. YS]WGD33770.1 ShlB/FhaC/HecB family hemolysin secretion/activation protein [Olleya sp. YS]